MPEALEPIIGGGLIAEIAARASARPAERHDIEAAREERRRNKTRHARDDYLAAAQEPMAERPAPAEGGGMSDEQRRGIDALLQRRRTRRMRRLSLSWLTATAASSQRPTQGPLYA